MHLSELESAIEYEAREAVLSHYPLDWKEDAINHALMIRLRRSFTSVVLHGHRAPLQAEWEVYKLHGKRETHFGDVGVLVRYTLPAGRVVEGAGFLEAKVRGRDTTKFSQVRDEQVRRIMTNSPHSRLLLYDYNPVAVLDDYSAFGDDFRWFPVPFRSRNMAPVYVTHAATVPLSLAAAINAYDDTLYPFAHSFASQVCRRYLALHDLDFSAEAIDAVKSMPAAIGGLNFILVIRAAPIGQRLPDPFRPSDDFYAVAE